MQAVTAKGSTPASNSPTDIANAIANIGERFYNAELVHRNNKSLSNGSKNPMISDTYTLKENGYYLAFLATYGSMNNNAYSCTDTASLTYNSSTSYTSDGYLINYAPDYNRASIHNYSKYAIFNGTKDKIISYSKNLNSGTYASCIAMSFGLFKVEDVITLFYKNKKTGYGTGSVTLSDSYNIATVGKYLVIVSSDGASSNSGYTDILSGIKTTIKFNDEITVEFPVTEKINIDNLNSNGSVGTGSISSDVKFCFIEGSGTLYVERYYSTWSSYNATASLEYFIFKIG